MSIAIPNERQGNWSQPEAGETSLGAVETATNFRAARHDRQHVLAGGINRPVRLDASDYDVLPVNFRGLRAPGLFHSVRTTFAPSLGRCGGRAGVELHSSAGRSLHRQFRGLGQLRRQASSDLTPFFPHFNAFRVGSSVEDQPRAEGFGRVQNEFGAERNVFGR